ncbi:aldehyde dehydrogenase family protein [Ruania alba]|uniref:Aldehyde dehydrogenase n=1 Tax=Ruania alba TaxID=648782 RepID=A0A1H5D721_9MICO|nr:aldehyde dehydrogenase family protein [Ruania alba]SED74510.1 coniferyl-aldehyde dehydrogenase [Ruania alba]
MSATTTSTPMSEVLQLQRTAFHRDGFPDAAVRRDRIDRFAHAVVSHTDALVEAISDDFGHRPDVTTLVSDIATLAADAELARARVGSWMRPQRPWGRVGGLLAGAAGLSAAVHPSPLGVVGVMGIWNFPINLTAIPALSALAAGNRVMIKMSEAVPATAEVFANAVHDAFDVEEVAVVTGDVEVSKEFSSLALDHLFFTGSAKVGSAVMGAAAKNLTPVTLELGGKNPVVVAPASVGKRSALQRAAQRVATARLVNAGQACIAPDEVYVPTESARSFVQEVFTTWGRVVPDLFERDEMPTLINDAAYERITALLEDAAEKGAQVLTAVRSDESGHEALRSARILPPTVVLGVTDEMDLAHEEVFGPVLAVHPYDDLDDLIDELADKPEPLVASWFGPRDADFGKFVAGTRSGGVARNDYALSQSLPGLPFGEWGHPGWGSTTGATGSRPSPTGVRWSVRTCRCRWPICLRRPRVRRCRTPSGRECRPTASCSAGVCVEHGAGVLRTTGDVIGRRLIAYPCQLWLPTSL